MSLPDTIITGVNRMLGIVGPTGKARINVLVIGDSNSAQPAGFQAILAEDPHYRVTNLSQAGRKTDWILQKVMANLQEGKYDYLIITGGINDIYSVNPDNAIKAADQAILNLRKAILWAYTHKTRPVVVDGINQNLRTTNNIKQSAAYTALKNKISSGDAGTLNVVHMSKYMKDHTACEDAACHAKRNIHAKVAADLKNILK